jgi:23S rRNA (uracil1939-C5)-methyltransferase
VTLIECDVERPVTGGDMLARHDGRILFVAGALPGERVRAEVVRTRGKVAWAQVRDVLVASADRRPVDGDPRCGGRAYAHVQYDRQLTLKAEVVADAFRRIAKLPLAGPIAVAPSPEDGYRLRARLHVRDRRVGFFREGSHVLCDVAPTRQLSSDAWTSVERLAGALSEGVGAVDSFLVSESADGNARVVTCVLHAGAALDPFLGMTLPEGLSGVVIQTPKGDFVAAGVDRLVDRSEALPGPAAPGRPPVTWVRRGQSFFQGNRFLLGTLLDRVLSVASGDRFVDLYAGVGFFSLALAARGQRGLAVEGDPGSAADLRDNAVPHAEQLDVQVASVEAAVAVRPARGVDVVVLDPPRAGVSAAALDNLLAWDAPRIVYVSCDVATLARDAGRLVAGGYRLSSLEGFDMFPATAHIECLAVFDRA